MNINADFSQRVVLRAEDRDWVDSPMPGVQRLEAALRECLLRVIQRQVRVHPPHGERRQVVVAELDRGAARCHETTGDERYPEPPEARATIPPKCSEFHFNPLIQKTFS